MLVTIHSELETYKKRITPLEEENKALQSSLENAQAEIEDLIVRSFCETLQHSGHWRTFNLLTGKCMLHRGRGSAHDFCWEDNNIPLSLPLNRKVG